MHSRNSAVPSCESSAPGSWRTSRQTSTDKACLGVPRTELARERSALENREDIGRLEGRVAYLERVLAQSDEANRQTRARFGRPLHAAMRTVCAKRCHEQVLHAFPVVREAPPGAMCMVRIHPPLWRSSENNKARLGPMQDRRSAGKTLVNLLTLSVQHEHDDHVHCTTSLVKKYVLSQW